MKLPTIYDWAIVIMIVILFTVLGNMTAVLDDYSYRIKQMQHDVKETQYDVDKIQMQMQDLLGTSDEDVVLV
ncbi:MAG: hypothetical protein PHR07_08040 [Acidaminococcaceae bacterium]|nr:hypothetical protein [Acidaminococcaceae bacterium]